MSEQQHTPTRAQLQRTGTILYALETAEGKPRNRFDANVNGPHCPGDELEANARLVKAAWNMAQNGAERLGMDPLTLAERLEDGGIADLIENAVDQAITDFIKEKQAQK